MVSAASDEAGVMRDSQSDRHPIYAARRPHCVGVLPWPCGGVVRGEQLWRLPGTAIATLGLLRNPRSGEVACAAMTSPLIGQDPTSV